MLGFTGKSPGFTNLRTSTVTYGDNAMSDGMVRKWVRMLNKGRENVHDEAWSGRPYLVNDDLVRKVNENTNVSQFLICPCTFQRFQGLYDIVSSHLGYRRPHSVRRVHKNLCTAIMSANMWENSLKNVESDKNKILHENLLDFFYSETVLTFWMNLVTCITLFVQTFNSFGNINFWLIKHLTNYFL